MQISSKLLLKTIALLFVLSFCFSHAEAQKKIQYRAEWSYHDEDVLPGITKLVGNVVFKQDEIVGYCDSAYLYENSNLIEAFGRKVKILINDSVTLYGKYVMYDGNTKMASISKNVILEDKTSALYTDSLTYDLNNSVAYYLTGGKMINQDNTLTSKLGYYYTETHKVYLHQQVTLFNESYTMTCDSLAYNSDLEIVYFISRTHLVSEENQIFTTSGWYDTKKDISLLVKDVEIYNQNQQIFGDSIYYDKIQKYGTGWNNIIVNDTAKGYILQGNYVEYYESGGVSSATDSAMLILIDAGDSLYIHADIFHIYIDSVQEPQLILAFNHVKFFRTDMQGACDSMSYSMSDSLLVMYYNPVIWTENYQMTADTIFFSTIDSVHSRIHLNKAAFIVSSLYGDTEFNQIKGTNIYGLVHGKELQQVNVIGNAECLYYLQDDDGSLIGINSSITSEMRILFSNKEISSLTKYDEPTGKIYPDEQLSSEDRKLKDFRWLGIYRPLDIKDIFHTSVPREKEVD
jgi:lipopolysaccharide export system protein LptA